MIDIEIPNCQLYGGIAYQIASSVSDQSYLCLIVLKMNDTTTEIHQR
jgi:hypothetical protein